MDQNNRFVKFITQPLFWVFGLAFFMRLFACFATHIINPDGIHYIYQAQSIYYGKWDILTSCHLTYVSPLPMLIVIAHTVFRDWVIAGQFVSFAFSFGAMFPLYFLIKRFFEPTVTVLTLLVYALIPAFINRSADIVRDPIFWFLLCSGMLLFVRHFESPRGKLIFTDLLYSALLFLLAMWTRIEGVVFFVASGAYLLCHVSQHKLKRLLSFFAPIILILVVVGCTTLVVNDMDRFFLKRMGKIGTELTQFSQRYDQVRHQLDVTAMQSNGMFQEFLREVHKVVWAVPLAMLFNAILDGFFYPNALLLFLGLSGLKAQRSRHAMQPYFIWIVIISLIVLYIHILQIWMIFNRFMAIVIYPSFIFLGYGIEKCLTFFEDKYRIKYKTVIIWMVLILVGFGLGKSLHPIHADKAVYPQIGKIIAANKAPDKVALIMGKQATILNWIFFYAHRDYPEPLCAKNFISSIPPTYAQMLQTIEKEKISFVLYEEKSWKEFEFNLMSQPYQKDFDVLGQWHHKDTGDIILMSLKNS